MLRKIILFPLVLLVGASAAYEVWQHVGFPVTRVEAGYSAPAPSVRIIPSATNTATPSLTYQNGPFGFSISYPRAMVRESNGSLGWSYDTQVKNGALLLSLALPPQAPFVADGGLGVLRIGVANDAATVASCTKKTTAALAQGTANIGGQSFEVFSYPSEGIKSYRVLRGGICYALEIQVKSVDVGKIPPASEAAAARSLFESIVATFRFS